jgi:hypothetical protein
MPGWAATITAITIITGIITAISVITIASTAITETDPRGAASSTLPPPRFAEISPGPHAIASPMAGGPVRLRQAFMASLLRQVFAESPDRPVDAKCEFHLVQGRSRTARQSGE